MYEEALMEKYNRKIQIYTITFVLSVMSYSVLIGNELTNTMDGMWHGSLYSGYNWVVSIGRWFWPVVGMMRNNLSPEPFTSVASIALFTYGACLITYLFGVKSQRSAVLVSLNLLVNTAVCVSLSYRFMSPTFALAFLFSVRAVCSLREKKGNRGLFFGMAVMFLVASLACYQMDLGCFCIMILLLTVKDMMEREDLKEAGIFILKAGACGAISCCLYKILWDCSLRILKIDAANYKGANQLSVRRMISFFPVRLLDAYKSFFSYYLKNDIKHHVFQSSSFYICVWILFFAGVLAVTWMKTSSFSKVRICLVCAALLLIPAAANVTMLIAVDDYNYMIQMTMPLIMVFPCLLSLIEGVGTEESVYRGTAKRLFPQSAQWMNLACKALMIFVLYGSFLMVSVDQHVMLVSRQTTLAFMNRVISGIETSSLSKPTDGYVFIGRPSDNHQYQKDKVWNYSNLYARYGDFRLYTNCGTQSYRGLMRDCGLNIPLNLDDKLWHQLEKAPEVIGMPVYPEEGYIKTVGSCVIVKLSDP